MGLKESGLRASVRSVSTVVPAFFDVAITDTNSPVNEGDVLVVDYSVDNTGDSFETQDIRLEIESVQEDADLDVSLSGGASDSGTLEWDTTNEDETTYTATVLSDDNTDSVTVEIEAAIPDSVIHYWPTDEGSGSTVEDNIGSADGDISGATWVDGNWQGGFALQYDGVDDIVDYPDVTGFADQADSNFVYASTFRTTDDNGDDRNVIIGGGISDTANGAMAMTNLDSPGDVALYLRDSNGDTFAISTTDNFADGERHRLVTNKVSNSGSDGIEIWIDAEEVSTTVIFDQGYSDPFSDWDNFRTGSNPSSASFDHFDGDVDDAIVADDSWTESEIQDDYDRQPWS